MPLDSSNWEKSAVVEVRSDEEAPPRSLWRRCAAWLAAIPLFQYPPDGGVAAAPVAPAPPKPRDARIIALEAGLAAIALENRPLPAMAQAASSPAAYYGALEAIHQVTGHPVHAIGYALERRQVRSRYSCDTSCMSPREVKDALKKAIKHIESDPTRTVL